MKNNPAPFRFKHFLLHQAHDVMKVSTDSIILGSWVNPVGAKNILDIGTGTGILALLMAQKSTAVIDAIDIDEKACSLGRKNFLESPWSNRLNVYETSVQNFQPNKKYDLIISNPPYFSNSLKSPNKARNIYRHDSAMNFHELIASINNLLTDNGIACIAIPALYVDSVFEKLPLVDMNCESMLLVSSNSVNAPYLALIKLTYGNHSTTSVQDLIIYTTPGKYSSQFIALTNDSYGKVFL